MSDRAHVVSDDAAYERDKRMAADPDVDVRRQVARSPTTRPEILYYLAGDRSAAVRREVAANVRTPTQADALLVSDPDEDVRADLARKVALLLPGLSPDEQDQAGRRVIDIVEALARDQAVRVRQVIAETLKDVAGAPPALIRRLARDTEIVVAEPVLRFSPLLTDEDLIEIIAAPPAVGARTAIARRASVTSAVADAIVATGDDAAVAVLLANPSAQIREETLDLIVDLAPGRESWHPGLVRRPSLPNRLVQRIARFVAAALLRELEQRSDLDPAAHAAVAEEVARRLEACEAASRPGEAPEPETAEEIVTRMKAKGELDEAAVMQALNEGRRPFVRAALVALSGLPADVVDRILRSHSAKGIVALVWKAGLSPRVSTQIQLRLGGIAPKNLLSPRGGGWPLTPEEMIWHLEFFGA